MNIATVMAGSCTAVEAYPDGRAAVGSHPLSDGRKKARIAGNKRRKRWDRAVFTAVKGSASTDGAHLEELDGGRYRQGEKSLYNRSKRTESDGEEEQQRWRWSLLRSRRQQQISH